MPAYPCVLRLPTNEQGRDFVIGDIHGAFTSVWRAMKEVRFNPDVDRLLCVGDLIDRGPDSHRVARFLAQPYVHSVLGNHEAMLLELYEQGEPPPLLIKWFAQRNGFSWWLGADAQTRQVILDAIRELPIVLEVDSPRGLVGLVHADVPAGMSWEAFTDRIRAGDKDVMQTALWGRDRLQSGDQSGVEGVGRVFVGHTIQWGGLRRLGNLYGIDTGAIFAELDLKPAARVTMVNSLMETQLLSTPGPQTRCDARDGAVPKHPFGQYQSLR